VCDALEPFGVRHIDKPLTPARVWAAIQGGKNGKDGKSLPRAERGDGKDGKGATA
jgi:hypothetical protein